MKKLLVLGLLAGLVGSAGAACMGPFCYDDTGAYVNGVLKNGNGEAKVTMTKAQMTAATPNAAGMEIYCSDCTTSRICISSGTTRGAYVVAVETGTFQAGTETHCK